MGQIKRPHSVHMKSRPSPELELSLDKCSGNSGSLLSSAEEYGSDSHVMGLEGAVHWAQQMSQSSTSAII